MFLSIDIEVRVIVPKIFLTFFEDFQIIWNIMEIFQKLLIWIGILNFLNFLEYPKSKYVLKFQKLWIGIESTKWLEIGLYFYFYMIRFGLFWTLKSYWKYEILVCQLWWYWYTWRIRSIAKSYWGIISDTLYYKDEKWNFSNYFVFVLRIIN